MQTCNRGNAVTYPTFILSGWAMSDALFQPVKNICDAEVLALPGIASWADINIEQQITWERLVNALDTLLPCKPVVLAGWSLGGLIATYYATLRPDKVKHLVLMGCNPCFVTREGWNTAMDKTLFHSFVLGMKSSVETTLKKFMLLCAQGSKNCRIMFRHLQQLMEKQSVNHSLLLQLLCMLSDDLRPVLKGVQCRVSHLLGKQDALVSAAITQWIEAQCPHHFVQQIDGGHLFFTEQPEVLARTLMEPQFGVL